MALASPLPAPESPRSRTVRRVTRVNGERVPLQRRAVVESAIAAERAAERRGVVKPRLELVPRRRRAAGIIAASCIVLFGLLLGAVAFQTRIAQNQLALDKTERAVRDARERYDILRRQRSQLRSPARLAVEAARLGMQPAENGEFMTVDPDVVASVAASASGLPEQASADHATSLEQFGEVKSVTEGAP